MIGEILPLPALPCLAPHCFPASRDRLLPRRTLDSEHHKRSSSRSTFGKKPTKWWVTGGGANVDLTESPDALRSAAPIAPQPQSQKSSRSSSTPQHDALRHAHSSQQRQVASLTGREENEVVDTEEEVADTEEEGNEGEEAENGRERGRGEGGGEGETEAGSFQCSTCSKFFESLQVLCLLRHITAVYYARAARIPQGGFGRSRRRLGVWAQGMGAVEGQGARGAGCLCACSPPRISITGAPDPQATEL